MKKILATILMMLSINLSGIRAQQPQASEPYPEPIVKENAWVTNGVAPGYFPYQLAAGLSLYVGPGTVPNCLGSRVEYAGTGGSPFTLTNNTTNYAYLKLDSTCAVTVDTTGPTNRDITIGKFVTSGGVVTSWKDDRTWDSSHVVFGGVNAQTGTSYTIANTDRNKDVTFSNSSAVAVTLPTTLSSTFAFATQNRGTGTVTFTPSSGTVNGASSLAMTSNTGGWLFFDGTNWNAVLGGGSGGGSTNTIHTCWFTFGDDASSSPVLLTGNNLYTICPNHFGADETIIDVTFWVKEGATTFLPITTGGSSTSILTGAITGSAGAWVAGNVNGAPVIHSFSSAPASTCPSTPCTIDANITPDGTTKYAVGVIDVVGPGGTGSTTVGTGGSTPNQLLINCGGLVCGVSNGATGTVLTSNGTSSAPTFTACPASNGENAQTASYTILAADNGKLVTMNGSSLTATMPATAPSTTWCVMIENLNATNLTISPNGLLFDGASASLTLAQYQSATIKSDGTNYNAAISSGRPAAHATMVGEGNGAQGTVGPGNTGYTMASTGSSTDPTFTACPLSNGSVTKTASYTVLSTDVGQNIVFNGSSLTATLPASPPTSTWCVQIFNMNTSGLTLSPNGLNINGSATNLTLAQYQGTIVTTDGSNYFAPIASSSSGGGGSFIPGPGMPGVICTNNTTGSGTSISCATTNSTGFNVIANQDYYVFCSIGFSSGTGTDTLTVSDTGPGGGSALTWASINNLWVAAQNARVAVFKANSGSATGSDTFSCNDTASFFFSSIAVIATIGSAGSDGTNTATVSSAGNITSPITTGSPNDIIYLWSRGASTTPTLNAGETLLMSNTSIATSLSYLRATSAGNYSNALNMPGAGILLTLAVKSNNNTTNGSIGATSAGPQLDFQQCSNTATGSTSSLSCSSTINTAVGDFYAMFCNYFTNDGGTATLAASDSLANSWNTAGSYYSTSVAGRLAVFWTASTHSGADTFTCTPSSAKTFSSIAVEKLTGVNAGGPIDGFVTNQGSTSTTHNSAIISSTNANDLLFYSEQNNSSASGETTPAPGFTVFSAGATEGDYLAGKSAGNSGTYTMSVTAPSSTFGNVLVAFAGNANGNSSTIIEPLAVSTQPWYPPAIPNAMNDEFTGSTFNLSGIWTAVNIGSCTMTQSNNSWMQFTCPSNGGSTNMRLQCQPLPAAPYTFESRIKHEVVAAHSGGFAYEGGLILRESSTGKMISLSYDENGTQIRIVNWTALGTDVNVRYSSGAIVPQTPFYFTAALSGTTLTWTWAFDDGALFTNTFSESLTTDFTTGPNQVCIGMSPYNAQWTFAIDLFRRTQ